MLEHKHELEGTYDSLIETICASFQLGTWSGHWERLGGSFNETLRLGTDQGTYVLRMLSPSINLERMNELQSIVNHLHDEGLPVAVPLLGKEQSCAAVFNGRLIQVTPNLPGRRFQCKEAQVKASGHMLKWFHRSLLGCNLKEKPGYSFYPPRRYYEDAMTKLGQLRNIPIDEQRLAACYIERTLALWEQMNELPRSILHGDWHFWNQLYTKSEISAVLDYDYMEKGIRIHDVAYALWCIYILLPEHKDSFDMAFLEGYGHLTDEEQALLPDMVARISLFFLLHSLHHVEPAAKWKQQAMRQLPLLQWLDGEGRDRLQAYQTLQMKNMGE
ncbi:phosphotransferase [Paenibacillus aquistagni]|uniref:Ser/Thr protein kinase RdoA involved in Cpx stress response, MazF antagonist n=1 Tax=Paenibacillus aquistagni TaxID=1852522 RepID=A0A1X7I992_9BACL|nr:phosphotransferase [Paenibacillus aquistagni]SMG10506.1 Ser/Thr protein kinase RdoA involved in Cpx stress response, MazF antagonist [Paenibacillus aquistagni]